jgi:hypothetical protein
MFAKFKPARERRTAERRPFPQYMQFKDDVTGELVGDLADISPDGFRLEGMQPARVNADFRFLIDMPPEIKGPSRIIFIAQSRWSRQHPLDPRVCVSGFQIQRMEAADKRAFDQLYAQCQPAKKAPSQMPDYLWKD